MMAKKPKSAKRPPSAAAEAELFRAVMDDVAPLDEETRRRYASETADSASTSAVAATVDGAKRTFVRKLSSPARPSAAPPAKSPAQPAGAFDRVTLRQVKQGKMAVEGRLDLHGLTQSQAHSRLGRFIEDSALAGKRCVLVITGKGAPTKARDAGGGGGHGVLRHMTPKWLSGADIAPFVVDFQSSLPRDGDTGAIYVRLRRPKSGNQR
jgi:DNA-nicking Smr family endonuclease